MWEWDIQIMEAAVPLIRDGHIEIISVVARNAITRHTNEVFWKEIHKSVNHKSAAEFFFFSLLNRNWYAQLWHLLPPQQQTVSWREIFIFQSYLVTTSHLVDRKFRIIIHLTCFSGDDDLSIIPAVRYRYLIVGLRLELVKLIHHLTSIRCSVVAIVFRKIIINGGPELSSISYRRAVILNHRGTFVCATKF